MCDIVGIDHKTVKINEKNSGGAQYLLKNIDYLFWEECERKCSELYKYFLNYEKSYPISHHIQKWTTDMWVVLWLYWKKGGTTIVHKELDFSWATGTVNDYNSTNIFHLAGITAANCKDKFHKGQYTSKTVFDAYFSNPTIFDHINKNNATFEYVKVIKEYVHNVYLKDRGLSFNNNIKQQKLKSIQLSAASSTVIDSNNISGEQQDIKRFRMNNTNIYAGIYVLDVVTKCCDKNLWRSADGSFVIFWSGLIWVLTYAKYEAAIGPKCGGIASSKSSQPYINNWNINNLTIDLL
jgi:hypothetical protein